ncbi:TPA: helix-turn-helix transcriptional regulator [Morganella morganii]|uniref:helix-turn-helix domain-containing protein n=2 Tax=Morganella morganii TaxID=582 RepID=UPI00091954E3|nr:helix-turn-helix transcriptional regulator [Morganella morganii]SGC50939.1 DNA-binding transcriptional repressor PuuR [Mycobacterium tuberculosis]SSN05642.1 DNA-binding transcriptional repressor PuuR [Klebsiella pneumoniae]EJD6112334.1 helix-turn-helix transcriptional regulator [Morganella morganii]EJG2205496.1 helix-turn-helix transcriptional regulator [Morganella morganii]EKU4016768.1 helix-turn-helix transcriptional regulator [Morganella morganii]
MNEREISLFIGQQISRKRKSLGLSGMALAELLGLSQQQISRYEQGITNIRASTLLQIAFLFNVDVKSFFTDCIEKNNKLSSLNYKEKKSQETDYDTITIDMKSRGRGKIRSKK